MSPSITVKPDEGSDEADPERLFETRNVDEIAAFSRSLEQDIDRKKEELRTMVGERYRDLMEAAETITRMREGAKNVIRSVELVGAKSMEIHSKALVGFEAVTSGEAKSSCGPDEDANRPYLTVASEIKLLMMAPEKIWTAVDQGDFLTASGLFLFARHIHTDLTLDSAPPGVDAASTPSRIVASCFPVVSRQWASIEHFHKAITTGCERALSENAQKSTDSLAALVLLEGLSSKDIFKKFLDLREAAILQTLRLDTRRETAKTLICKTLGMIMCTLQVIHSAFAEGQERSLVSVLKKLEIPTLSLFQTRLSPIFKYLPGIIRDFSPSLVEPLSKLDANFLASQTTAWLDKIHDSIGQATIDVLNHVGSIGALSAIKKYCYDYLLNPKDGCMKPMEWNAVCNNILDKELNLWNEFFRNVYRERVETLIKTQIAGAVYCIQSSLSVYSETQGSLDSELDLSPYLWAESNLNEVVYLPKFGEVVQEGGDPLKRSLELKAHGYSPKVQDLCRQFDNILLKVLDEVSEFVKPQKYSSDSDRLTSLFFLPESKSKEPEPFDPCVDNEAIVQFMQESVYAYVREMIDHISEKHIAEEKGDCDRGAMLFLGRFFQAIPDLCPSLKKCLAASQFLLSQKEEFQALTVMQQQRRAGLGVKADPQWTKLRTTLEEKSCAAFKRWLSALTLDLHASLEQDFSDEDPDALLQLFAAWDAIDISEEGEDGKSVKSRIRVPQHPSVPLARGLADYAHCVYRVAPYSMPHSIQLSVSQDPLRPICQMYRRVVERGSLVQMAALQLHFDLQFVSQCLVARENQESASELQSLLTALDRHIDPFDLSVFAPYVSTHVKRAVLRQAGLLSVIIPADRFSLLASMKSSLPIAAAGTSDQHNVLWTLSHRPEKIPLVPVPRRKKDVGHNSMKQRLLTTSVSGALKASSQASSISPVMGRRKREKSPVAKATGSFFEAMSTSWFGGK